MNIAETLLDAKLQLIQSGLVDSPKLDAELLLAHSLDKDRTYLFTWSDKALTNSQLAAFSRVLKQRLTGLPIAHILGYREFWGLNLKVTADTLIPRPDTETVIEAVLQLKLPQESRLLDMGTGSGAIALALKSELPNNKISAIDKSSAALKVAQENASQLGLSIDFYESDWFSALPAKTFACIVSNPPYIEEKDPHLQQGDVRFEPLSALTAGQDGLDDIRLIIQQAWQHLQPNGWLVIEHGYNQATEMAQLFKAEGYQNYQLIKDLGNNPRVSLAQKLN